MSESKFQRAVRAMEAAHAAGDTDAARELAVLARSLQGQAQPEDDAGLMGQVNRAIAEGLGGLVDFVNPFDKQMGSAKVGMTNLMEAGGVNVSDEAPEGFLENVAYGTGAGASALIPVGVGAKVLQGAGGLVGQIAQKVAPQLATKGGVAAELGAAAGSSAASGAAREAGYSPTVQQIAGLAGGFASPLTGLAARGAGKVALKAPVTGAIAKGVTKAVAPFTETGARQVAIDRMQGLAGGQARASELARRSEASENILGLSPAQRTGDEGLISLERATMKSDPKVSDRITGQMFESDEMVRKAIQSSGDVRDTQAFVAQRQAEFGRKHLPARKFQHQVQTQCSRAALLQSNFVALRS